MAVSHLYLFLESPGHWKIFAAVHGTHPICASLWWADRNSHAAPHAPAKVKDMRLPDMQGFLFHLQATPLVGYTGANASAVSRPARVTHR